LGSEKKAKKEKLQTASPWPSPSSSSLPYEDCNGKLTLPKHGRRIQAATNCSFFLSQNQIEQKKLLPETFFFLFFLNLFFPEENFLGHHQNSESVPRVPNPNLWLQNVFFKKHWTEKKKQQQHQKQRSEQLPSTNPEEIMQQQQQQQQQKLGSGEFFLQFFPFNPLQK
jgi:hypothetical protein